MTATITDKFSQVSTGIRPVTTTVSSVRNIGTTTLACSDLTGWTTNTAVHFVTYKKDSAGKVVAGSQTDWKGIVSGSNITNLTVTGGGDAGNAPGDIVEQIPTARYAKEQYDALATQHNNDGTHHDITSTNATITNLSVTNLTVGSQTPSADWTASVAPNTVTYNGNHSYTAVFNGTDLTGAVNPGTRIRTTRTVAAPTQCTSLNGTTQYWVKTSPAGMTFTNNFVVSAYVKMTSYPASGNNGVIASRYNGTSGWGLWTDSAGRVGMVGWNGGSANFRQVQSNQSLPLNRWVRVTVQLDMSSFTTTTTTCYVMLDDVDVPATLIQGGTNPTSLLQAGNLEIGSWNGGSASSLFPGKIAQVSIFGAKIAQSTMQGYASQGLLGTETNLISAYSFNGVTTDLNTTNANNLSAGAGSPTATNADSPFGGQASGLISSTLDYGIVQSATFSTNTTVVIQVPEGCTIPTSGGITAMSYSSASKPYGFPGDTTKWDILSLFKSDFTVSIGSINTWTQSSNTKINIPIGSWNLSYQGTLGLLSSVSGVRSGLASIGYSGEFTGSNQFYEAVTRILSLNSTTQLQITGYGSKRVKPLTATDYFLYGFIDSATGTESFLVKGAQGAVTVSAGNAYL